jgi:hypothetical protein
VLDHSEAYRFAAAPPPGFRWPPTADWNERVAATGREWRTGAMSRGAPAPRRVLEQLDILTRRRDEPLASIRGGADPELSTALLTLHAMSDEAGAGLMTANGGPFERRAWELLESHGSLSRLSPGRIRVLPKTRVPARGLTIRSFSRYFALSYEAVNVDWRRMQEGRSVPADRDFNVVLLPWPLSVESSSFRPVPGPVDNMDPTAFGFFEFAPTQTLPRELLAGVLRAAHRHVRRIDVLILPECALGASELPAVERVLDEEGVISLITGVREHHRTNGFGANRLQVAMRDERGWQRIEQAKHHRWCLDGAQIRQYHLSRALDPNRQWWEAIDLPERNIEVLDAARGTTVAPLICEDLARIDEVADVLRRIGPTLVVAVLLDGPQLRTRWPCRYASVLSDDPGSAVLTLTSLGMARRSRPPSAPVSRVVASWSDAITGTHELELERGASVLLVTGSGHTVCGWTADGRHHEDIADLSLSSVRQLSPS